MSLPFNLTVNGASSLGYQDLYVDQGADYSVTIVFMNFDGSALNVANLSFSANIKTSYIQPQATDSLTCNVANVSSGVLILTYDAANNTNIYAQNYVYDLLAFNTGTNTTIRVLNGGFFLNPGVTHITSINGPDAIGVAAANDYLGL